MPLRSCCTRSPWAGGKIVEIHILADPARLRDVDLTVLEQAARLR
jgi:hypothetical protein